MEIQAFIDTLKIAEKYRFKRGYIIDCLASLTSDWCYALKALLIKSPFLYISKDYLLGKLNFMKNHPETPEVWLDFQGIAIFRALRGE